MKAKLTLVLVSGCSRDPNVLKEKYLQSGKRYFTNARYKEASIMFRKAIEINRR